MAILSASDQIVQLASIQPLVRSRTWNSEGFRANTFFAYIGKVCCVGRREAYTLWLKRRSVSIILSQSWQKSFRMPWFACFPRSGFMT